MNATNKKQAIRVLTILSILFALLCVPAGAFEWNRNNYSSLWGLHRIALLFWIAFTFTALHLTKYRNYRYYLLFLLSPIAIWPFETWFFIIYSLVDFAP